jgi:hypothetical protein
VLSLCAAAAARLVVYFKNNDSFTNANHNQDKERMNRGRNFFHTHVFEMVPVSLYIWLHIASYLCQNTHETLPSFFLISELELETENVVEMDAQQTILKSLDKIER